MQSVTIDGLNCNQDNILSVLCTYASLRSAATNKCGLSNRLERSPSFPPPLFLHLEDSLVKERALRMSLSPRIHPLGFTRRSRCLGWYAADGWDELVDA